MNPIAEFLVAHERIMAPVIEWGGLLLYLAIILSPFLIIRFRAFRPTRWWHVAGAYVSSVAILIGLWYLIDKWDQPIVQKLLVSLDLNGAYTNALVYGNLWLVAFYPFLVFYSSNLLYGSFTKKRFVVTLGMSVLLLAVVVIVGGYIMAALVGKAFTTYL